jgi:hypothetical protein
MVEGIGAAVVVVVVVAGVVGTGVVGTGVVGAGVVGAGVVVDAADITIVLVITVDARSLPAINTRPSYVPAGAVVLL